MISQEQAKTNMIKQQLRTGDVLDEVILDLYERIPRHAFVPAAYEAFAYSDMQIPLAYEQRMMTPLEEAKLLQALDLKGHEKVLEIGTGSGFLTALLSQLSQWVLSIDCHEAFTLAALEKFKTYSCLNIEAVIGDGIQGWLAAAPYDLVIFTGALKAITDTHLLQIMPGGKLFAVVGQAPVMQGQLHSLSLDGKSWQMQVLFETELPFLIDRLAPKVFTF